MEDLAETFDQVDILATPTCGQTAESILDSISTPEEKLFAITGIGRPPELVRIQTNFVHEAVITIPWDYPGFSERYSIADFEAWTMEKVPAGNMSYDLPSRYKQDREDEWSIPFVSRPWCVNNEFLVLVKTARPNRKNREIIRKYYNIIQKTDALRFIIGTGKA